MAIARASTASASMTSGAFALRGATATPMKSRSWIITKGGQDGKENEAGASGRDSPRGVHDPIGIEHEQDGHGFAGRGSADRGHRERAPRHHRRHGAALRALFQKLPCILDESPDALPPGSCRGRNCRQGCSGRATSRSGYYARGLTGGLVSPQKPHRLTRKHSSSTHPTHRKTPIQSITPHHDHTHPPP